MEGAEPHLIPSIYLANYLNEYENVIVNYEVQKKQLKKGGYLTQYGVINNTAYYIKKDWCICRWDTIRAGSR